MIPKIFIPSINKSTYIKPIVAFSEFEITHDHFLNYHPTYNIINIHWPEAIFDWNEPTIEEIDILMNEIVKWKKSAILIYTKHDRDRVKGWTKNFRILFRIIEENSAVFVHLGEYSRNYYKKKYPKKEHVIIPHPIFDSFEIIHKKEARKKLGIDENALVVTAPGQIRSKKERDLLLKTFQGLELKNKVLISTNMRNEMEWDFPGRIKLNKLFNIKSIIKNRFEDKYSPPEYLFTYSPQSNYKFSLQIASADIIFIPRIDLLNTGNVLLGLTFNKIVVGPAIGNIKEQLLDHNLPIFNPNSISSSVGALREGLYLYRQGVKPIVKDKYLGKNVAKDYDKLYKNLVDNDS